MWAQVAMVSLRVATRIEERRQDRINRRFSRRLEEIEGPHAFISYSRSETPLVEDLVENLKENGTNTFVDFRNLEPGLPWDEQLESAIDQSSSVVLIVSERSIHSSQNARCEWKRALDRDKRIVLAIVEPVALPAELFEGTEWIDLRKGSFRRSAQALAHLLENPAPPTGPPPMHGSRPQPIIWVGVLLAAMAAITSIPLFWTIALPVVLVPLPIRILRRNFTYQTARAALAGECLLLFVLSDELFLGKSAVFPDEELLSWLYVLTVPTLPLAALLVIRSRSFRRWMTPRAARPSFPALPSPSNQREPVAQRYAVDAAGQDERYVAEVVSALDTQGHIDVSAMKPTSDHRPAPDSSRPDIVLRFVSKFNDTSEVTPDVLTLPILISDPDEDLPPHLSRTQWLDFRHGGRIRRRLEAQHLAFWLDRPTELLRPLGVAPPHDTRILPRGVQTLHDLLWACLVVTFTLVFVEVRFGPAELGTQQWIAFLLAVLAFVGMTWRTLVRLTNRRPTRGWALYVPVLLCLFFLLTTVLVGFDEIRYVLEDEPDVLAVDTAYRRGAHIAIGAEFFALLALPVGWLISRAESARWVPSVVKPDRRHD